MRTLAAIDVGANAIRMAVATLDDAGRLSIIDRVREPVRLGTDVFASGSVSEEAIERVTDAFIRLRALVDRHGATQVRAVGTSALREAANQELVLDRVFQASGIDVEVVSADEEARLIFLGVASRVDLTDRRALMIDIGGGSVEISLAADGRLLSTSSFKLGAVRLLQVLEEKKYGERQFGRLVHGYVSAIEKLLRQEMGQPVDLCVGTGGNIESLWELCRSLSGEDRGGVFSQGELDTVLKKLQSLTIAERIHELGLRPDRADVIVPAAIVLQHVLALAGTVDVMVPQVGLREGLLADMASASDGKRHAPPRDQLMSWALRLGRKYAFDEPHGTTVARLAAQMFDATKAVHHLDDEHRLLLELAALLHDVGHFINVSEHHKHTYYLLTANPILGLSEAQMAVVANVARYHRKSPPKPHHRGYMALGPKERVATSKLAALLRVADALDTQHKGKVTDLMVDSNRRQLVIRLKGDGDLLLEKWKVMKKAGMFEEVFSLKCLVE
ncbi:MAG: Ppx/GppA phosphatase family protein [Nitrospirota bacterium]